MNPPVPGDEASRKESGETSRALPAVLMIWLSVTSASSRRCGSTKTCNCRSRKPQVETFATPSTPSSRGVITHLDRMDISIGVSSSDDSFTIATRPVEETGWIICGGFATCGRPAAATAWVRRSPTTWRASSTLVPGSKVMTTDESPGSETDSISSRNAIPTSRSCSRGTVISSSTSSAESPRASVWTSTVGRWNSGRMSVRALSNCRTP